MRVLSLGLRVYTAFTVYGLPYIGTGWNPEFRMPFTRREPKIGPPNETVFKATLEQVLISC